jgi:hypothetical protein
MASIKCTPSLKPPTSRNYTLNDIGIGTIFKLSGDEEDELFIKASFGIADYECNAVSLLTGEATEFYDDDEIEIVRCITYSEDDVDKTTPLFN